MPAFSIRTDFFLPAYSLLTEGGPHQAPVSARIIVELSSVISGMVLNIQQTYNKALCGHRVLP